MNEGCSISGLPVAIYFISCKINVTEKNPFIWGQKKTPSRAFILFYLISL